jgi:hypothetical protein
VSAALKAAYGVSELALLTGLSRHQVYKRIRKLGLVGGPHQPGHKIDVTLSAFREAMPELWDSVLIRCGFADAD